MISQSNRFSSLRVRLENDPVAIGEFVANVRESLVETDVLDTRAAQRLAGAVDEALQNACFHGNLEVASILRDQPDDAFRELADRRRCEPPYRDRVIEFAMDVDDESVRITIRDEGPGFDVASIREPTCEDCLTRAHGRGLLMMRAFVDEVRYNDVGNAVTLVTRRSATPNCR